MAAILVRTMARYSRTAMTQILCMGHFLGPGAVGRGDAYEDVMERRVRDLEVFDGAALHKLLQKSAQKKLTI